jgi:hypothetical protein
MNAVVVARGLARLVSLASALTVVNLAQWVMLRRRRQQSGRTLKDEMTHLDILLPAWARRHLESSVRGPNRNFSSCGGVCPQAGCTLISLDLSKAPVKDHGPMRWGPGQAGEREIMSIDQRGAWWES